MISVRKVVITRNSSFTQIVYNIQCSYYIGGIREAQDFEAILGNVRANHFYLNLFACTFLI